MRPPVKVSVHMPAFNHGPYIADAIESVLAQRVGVRYEIVIGDDGSTDDTRAVARRYADRYGDRIRLLDEQPNVGIFENDRRILAACRGEYVAWLEGDDYWTSPGKLQQQVELLDANPAFAACFHRAGCTGGPPPAGWHGGPPIARATFDVDDLLAWGHFIPSCTLMFRAAPVRAAAEWTRQTPFLERTYAARLALAGPIGFIDAELAAFRSRPGGIYGRETAEGNLRSALATHRLIGAELRLTDRPAYRAGLARLDAALTQA